MWSGPDGLTAYISAMLGLMLRHVRREGLVLGVDGELLAAVSPGGRRPLGSFSQHVSDAFALRDHLEEAEDGLLAAEAQRESRRRSRRR